MKTERRAEMKRPHEAGRIFRGLVLVALVGLAPAAMAQVLPPVEGPEGEAWRSVQLPRQTLPPTRYSRVSLDGAPALRLEAEGSYGHLVHDLPPATVLGRLRWQWRLDTPNPAADLGRKAGDDNPVKVCVLFDLPIERVPFIERQLLRLARAASGERLPAATLCYVWDSRLPAGTVLPNAYTRRVRLVVLRGPEAPLGRWQDESRDVAADLARAYGDELQGLPPAQAVLVGADADNTGGHSVAHLRALQAEPERAP